MTTEEKLKLLPPVEEERSLRPTRSERINMNVALVGRWMVNAVVFSIGDALAICLAMVCAGALRGWLLGVPMVPGFFWFLIPIWWGASVITRLVPGWGIGHVEELRRSVMLVIGLFTMITLTLFLTKISTQYSRLTLTLGFIMMLPLVPMMRSLVKALLIRIGFWGMQAVVYGDREAAGSIIRGLLEDPGLGYVPVAVYDESLEAGSAVEGVRCIGESEIPRLFVHAAIIAKPNLDRHSMLSVLEGPLAYFRHVVTIPDLREAPSLWVKPRDLGGVLGLEVTSNLLDLWARILKRCADLTLVLLTAPLWIPAVLLLALLVRVIDGFSPFFWQERVGQHGQVFKILKFRTMPPNAEEVLRRKLEEDPELKLEWERNFKLRRDPRISTVGRFLRRTSLDELPQLVNVLRGQMALVGPRPLPRYHNGQLPENVRSMREVVLPGLTGLWQVSGRSESGNDGIIKWDSYYVRNWSIWLDILVLWRTVRAVVLGKGAY